MTIMTKGGEDMAVRRIRFTISVEGELYDKIEDFQFDARFKNTSRATEDLIRRGLRTYYGEGAVPEMKKEPSNV